MLADVQPDSSCLTMCGLNGGRQRLGKEERLIPVCRAGTQEAVEDKGLLQGHIEIEELDTDCLPSLLSWPLRKRP